jgi:hypothetical protein
METQNLNENQVVRKRTHRFSLNRVIPQWQTPALPTESPHIITETVVNSQETVNPSIPVVTVLPYVEMLTTNAEKCEKRPKKQKLDKEYQPDILSPTQEAFGIIDSDAKSAQWNETEFIKLLDSIAKEASVIPIPSWEVNNLRWKWNQVAKQFLIKKNLESRGRKQEIDVDLSRFLALFWDYQNLKTYVYKKK